jgi:hypothetical protein
MDPTHAAEARHCLDILLYDALADERVELPPGPPRLIDVRARRR